MRNAIDAVHRQFHKLTKKDEFPNEKSLLKLLYTGMLNASKKTDNATPELEYDIVSNGDSFEGHLVDILDI